MRILIVEDEKHLADAISELLKKENFTVDVAYDGEEGLDCAYSDIYDLILLDIMLPKINGIDILKELRSNNVEIPILLLTARDQLNDKVHGLNSGADDYLTKPFAKEELIARVKALLRRQSPIVNDNLLSFNDLELDYQNLTLYCKGKSVTLTLKESELLQFLIVRNKLITPKELLIEKLWGYDSEAEDNNVEVYISFLRKKFKFLKSETTIKNTRGAGYNLEVSNV